MLDHWRSSGKPKTKVRTYIHTYVHVWSVYKIGNMYGTFVVSET